MTATMVGPAQLDLFAVGRCFAEPCTEPATHRACATHPELADPIGIDCCLAHANYYTGAWFPIYPGQRVAVWLEVIE